MSRIILFGTGSAALDFLSMVPDTVEIVGLMDNDASKHGSVVSGHQVLAPSVLRDLDFDYVVIAARAVDAIAAGLIGNGVPEDKIVAFYPSYSQKLHQAANRDLRILTETLGLTLPPMGLATMYLDPMASDEVIDAPQRDFVRNQAFRLAARQITNLGVDGAIAELGVYQGDQAMLLNTLFPDRPLYLFDTFSGFSEKDLGSEAGQSFSTASVGDFANTSVALVMGKMPYPDQIKIFQGYFPETASGIEERFAFVSLDVDLYEPTLAGLECFTSG
ncbi:TylF/MycF/NovP-related O-methyltransferase [Sphingomonas sp. PB4P5]|uniref:TylF/MycF/NovP-related O-methyltransferase n=1 Tax=Parasphingomonas puruogangriensis TaxID=3096155 RepID=UPI002FCC8ACE